MRIVKDEIKELLQKTIAKAYELNENSKYNIFINFSGHVNRIDVHYNEKPYSFDINTNYICLNEKVTKDTLTKVLEKLEELEER